MKILILAGNGSSTQQVRTSYAHAMAHIGFQCLVWHPNSGKPIFDVFTEFEPDIVMCGSWEIDRALYKNLISRPHIKMILWGSIDSDNIKVIIDLIKNNNIEYIFTHHHQRWADVTHNNWKNIGLTPIGIPLAADLVMCGLTQPIDSLVCNVSFIGGYSPHRAKFIIPLCHQSKKINIKIFGYDNWSIAQFLGKLDSQYLPYLFSSSSINLNTFREPTTFYVNERCYNIIACGGFCISEYCDSAVNDIFVDDEMVFARTPEQMEDYVNYYIAHPDDRLPYIKRGIYSAKTKNNYFIRLHTILDKIGITNNNLTNTIENLKR